MKKILLIGFLIFCIFQMVVLATAIDVGGTAEDRDSYWDANYTIVDKTNPADGSGTITTIELWARLEMENCEIATFFVVSGNNLSTRDTVTLGTVTIGEHSIENENPITLDSESNPISLTVVEGDYITHTAGRIERGYTGGDGNWYASGDYIPCTNQAFSYTSEDILSVYGTGATADGFALVKFNNVTVTKWNELAIIKWNNKNIP